MSIDPSKALITFFCGFGGSESGAHQAGLSSVIAIDNNDADPETGKERLPAIATRNANMAMLGEKVPAGVVMDVNVFDGSKYESRFLTASPPCKRFSTSAEQWDAEDEAAVELDRDLRELGFTSIRKALQVKSIEYYVMENVTGLANQRNRSYLDGMIKLLRDAGWNVECQIYNAAAFGCCQERERLIMIGSKSGTTGLLPTAPAGLKRKIFAEIMEKADSKESKKRLQDAEWPQSTYATAYMKQARGSAIMKIIIPSLKEAEEAGWEKKALDGLSDIMPTIACNAGGGPTRKKWMILPFEGSGFRNATLLEGLRAQDFPDEWLENLPKNKSVSWNMIGNAVPRCLMFYIFQHLLKIDAHKIDSANLLPRSATPLPDSFTVATRSGESPIKGIDPVF